MKIVLIIIVCTVAYNLYKDKGNRTYLKEKLKSGTHKLEKVRRNLAQKKIRW